MSATFSCGAMGSATITCPLAPLGDPVLVAPAIAGVLGVQEAAGQALVERLKAALRDKQQR